MTLFLIKAFDIIVCSPQGDIDDQKVNKSTSISGFEEKNLLTSGCWWGLLSKREHILVDLFDSGSGSCTGGCTCTWHTSSTWGHTSGHTTWGTSCCLVKLGNDWVANAFNLEKIFKNILNNLSK